MFSVRSKSLLGSLILSILVMLIGVGGCVLLSVGLSNAYISRNTQPFQQLLSNKELLSSDAFDKISAEEVCDYLVFSETDELLYSTDHTFSQWIQPSCLILINQYQGNHYEIDVLKDGTRIIQLTDGAPQDYCIINNEGLIISGNMCSPKKILNDFEVELLSGTIREKLSIEKYVYRTRDGKKRTVVGIYPVITVDDYHRIQMDSMRFWWFTAAGILLLFFFEFLFIRSRLKRSLSPVNKMIEDYQVGKDIIYNEDVVVSELRPLTKTLYFQQLQINEHEAMLKREQEERQRIIAALCHDIKTPLTVLKGYTEAIQDGTVPSQKGFLIFKNRLNEMAGLTESLSLYTRLEHPDYRISRETVDLCEFLRRYYIEIYELLEAEGIHLNIFLPEKGTPCDIDIKMMHRVFENLTSNAIQHCGSGGNIWVVLEKALMIDLYIANDGAKIPSGLRTLIFDPFVTENESRTEASGTGLGLTICKKIVELHDGTIELSTSPNFGTTEFHISLPVHALENGFE